MQHTLRLGRRLVFVTLSLLAFAGTATGEVRITTDQTVGAGDRSLEGQEVVVSGATLTLAGPHTLAGLQLRDGAVLTHPPAPSGAAENALRLTLTGNLIIDATSRLDVTGRGYGEAGSPGAGGRGSYSGGGGGHAGPGGIGGGNPGGSAGLPHGDAFRPDSWGGPGGNGATDDFSPGGGLVILIAGGTVQVDGAIRADGAVGSINNQGGGAGGTVRIEAAALRGAGVISANGGAGEWVDGGGGSGGRIALLTPTAEFTGTLQAQGAGGSARGAAGTVFLRSSATATGELRLENAFPGAWTPIVSTVASDLTLRGDAIAYPAGPLNFRHVMIADRALLTQVNSAEGIELRADGNVTIDAGAALSVDGRGYPFDGLRGPGAGIRAAWAGSGAGHGGWGGHSHPSTGGQGGANYGSILQPVDPGSQGGDSDLGPGAAGGGVIRLVVAGTLQVQGRLSANGLDNPVNNAGGGSGGSLWVTAGRLTGEGLIHARGGAGEWVDGGGGAGGRIALELGEDLFNGSLAAIGGGGSERGGAGTVYVRRQGEPRGQLRVDNGGTWGNYTPLTSPAPFDLVLAGRAWVFPEAPLEIASLNLPEEAVLTHLTGQSNLTVHVLGDMTIGTNSAVSADGRGYPVGDNPGPGAGTRRDWAGSGGGHGGLGGTTGPGAAAGRHYGSILEPMDLGSAGGAGGGGAGTAGGGAIRLLVDGRLTVHGRLTADGAGSPPNDAGGGSGGSLYLTVGTLSGAGTISANGGPGEWVDGGGGSGGRIALYHGANEFTGSLTAYGGGGHQRGGAGTLYLRRNGTAYGHVRISNGGTWGAYTPLTSPEAFHLTLAEMASVYPETPLLLRDLDVEANALLTHLVGQSRCEITVRNNLTVARDGAISTDGRGYPVAGDRGPGAGSQVTWAGSGGGHGGTGGASVTGAPGGGIYGSIVEPLTAGSQGGSGDGGPGGAGGGVVRLIVANTLAVEGRITANGLNGIPNNAGGGAGGSLFLTAGTLTGSGVLSANGGSGEWVDGGGGAGGRIALHLGTQSFSGTLTAQGGGGSVHGGAGTLYTRLGGETGGELVFDNGGTAGALTPLEVPPGTRLVVAGGGTLHPVGTLDVVSLRLKPGATLTHLHGQPAVDIRTSGDLIIESGATLTAFGKGYATHDDPGPGAGESGPVAGGGGAHGGNGGLAWPGSIAGGVGYGSVLQPVDHGSSGGSGDGAGNARCPGGGAIRLRVGGTLAVEGVVTADGTSAWYNNQGGGAGGSIWITAAQLTGGGTISANGGIGEWVDGGAGGGGRLALYLGADAFTGTLTAAGGRSGHQPGGAGTIYIRLDDQPVGDVLVDNGGVRGAQTPLDTEEAFHLTLARQAVGHPRSTITVRSLVVAPDAVLTHRDGQLSCSAVVLDDARIEGTIDVNGLGYPIGSDPGPGAGQRESWAGSGAGHGGEGGRSVSGAVGGAAYGSRLEPTTLGSQGGSGDGGPGGAGGGAVRLLVGRTLTLDGTITANALNGVPNNAGGGSGGSVLVTAREFAGSGAITVNGGAGEWVDGGGGAGGRIAIYRSIHSFTGSISATGGGGSARAEDGSIHVASAESIVWLAPSGDWVHGEVPLDVALFTDATGPLQVRFHATQNGTERLVAETTAVLAASALWNTTEHADGPCELRVEARSAAGSLLAESRRSFAVNNAVQWHGGLLAESETWPAGRVHVVDRDLTIPGGVTLTLAPGAIAKFAPGVSLTVLGGGAVAGLGTAEAPSLFTSFLDDRAGGDSNLDGDASRPTPGSWRLVLYPSAELTLSGQTRVRYHSQTYGGTLAGSETWTGDSLRLITRTIVVPTGATLRLEAGAILKFAPGQGLDVQAGATLVAEGTAAEPVILTSLRDDAYGGDSNEDGSRSEPAAGDWRSVRFADGATGTLNHAALRYGGNSVGNPWGAGGTIESLGGPLTVRNSVIADALKDGAFCYGTTRFENCLVLRCDRGLTAVGSLEAIHCTVDECRIGLLEHVGQLTVRNTLVSRSIESGISHDLGSGNPVVTHCNVWNPDASVGNYAGTEDRTGRDGNISAEPRFKDPSTDNFRLNFASPGIDAADGSVAPATDFAGAPRYDDPRTGNTGTPSANGAIPDIGAFEFTETAPSNLDLVVAAIHGPTSLTAGEVVHVDWLLRNHGTEAFTGPWHDALYLVDAASGRRVFVTEALVGRSLTLGPGQSHLAGADVRIPGGINGTYHWAVDGNSRGDIFEGANTANNTMTSEGTTSLAVPELSLDGPALGGTFAAQEEWHWFRCAAPAGRDVRIDLDLAGTGGISEIYVGRGFLPTPETFTARQREFGAADTSVLASAGTHAGADGTSTDFYVLVIGRALASVPQGFSVRATSAAFTLDSVIQTQVGTAGEVTLEVHGSGLTPETTFALRLGTERRDGVRQSVRDSGRAFVTFDLRGWEAGTPDLLAEQDGLAVTLPAAVELVPGGTGDFYATLQGPGTTRAGRLTTWFVTYGNRGLVDVRLPLLRLTAPGATEIQLYESTLNWADGFHFLALNPEVLLPTLGPGQEVTFAVRLKVMGTTQVQLRIVPGEALATSLTAFNWSSLAAPAGANPAAWAAWTAGLTGRLGATVGDYTARLETDLAELRASPIRYSYVANIDGRWLFGDEGDDYGEEIPIIEIPPEEEDPAMPARHAPPARIPGDGIRKTWWVVITVEDYANRRRPDGTGAKDLPGTRVDWNDLDDYMRRDTRVPDDQIAGGHDAPNDGAAWTRDHILSALRSFRGRVDADDNLVVVFSGHGGRTRNGTGYLCGNGGSVSPAAFTRAIDEVGAGTTYFLNDSCHSEAFNDAVDPANTTFVGMAGTMADRTSRDTAHGGELISNLKKQLRRCRSLGRSFELTEAHVSNKYKDDPTPKHRQHPVLTNPTNAGLDGKPWNDPSGFEQELKRAFDRLAAAVFHEQTLSIVGSVDPNDKYALAGAGPERWVQPSQVLPFEVVFENKTNAAAPAQEVLVMDDLDPRYDWSTFELKSIAFNDAKLTVPPGLQRFTGSATVGSDPYPVDIDVRLDPVTGRITWWMRSLDPATGDLPEDPFAGFLPPNDASHRGEGSLTYTIRPLPGLADGTALTNKATIFFDPTYGANPPIATPMVTNTLDGLPPSSAVQALPASVTGAVTVQWSGTDAPGGSGIASYDVYVSKDDEPYALWQIAARETSASLTGQPGSTYRFYSVARDAAGNTEAAPSTPDAVTTVSGGVNFAQWAATQGLPPQAAGPEDDPDGDGLRNFAEYALALHPMQPDAHLARPVAGLVNAGGQRYLSLTYRRPRTQPSDVRYRITTSPHLAPWTGSSVIVPVGLPVDRGTHVEVTVRASEPVGTRAHGFLRLVVER